jgi:hypothetical protein
MPIANLKRSSEAVRSQIGNCQSTIGNPKIFSLKATQVGYHGSLVAPPSRTSPPSSCASNLLSRNREDQFGIVVKKNGEAIDTFSST